MKELALRIFTNEGLVLPVKLKTRNSAGVVVPLNVTGAEFQCQVKKDPLGTVVDATMICEITNATLGEITITLPVEVVATLVPDKYFYNVVMLPAGGQPTSLWTSTIVVAQGVTSWQ